MSINKIKTRFMEYYAKWNGSTIEKDLTNYSSILAQIYSEAAKLKTVTTEMLKVFSDELKQRAQSGEPLTELLPRAFALVMETSKRALKLEPFEEQIIAGIATHSGKLAEMQTGEGKTLMAVFPAYLNALTGKGVHILTFNDYLARRDAEWMGPIYYSLGINVGYVQEGMTIVQRKKAYAADITYICAKECGFDYLRDNMCYSTENQVQRPFNYALVDEADSIMIDEARIPLIIAGATEETELTEIQLASSVTDQLQAGIDFGLDKYARNVILTANGISKIENILGIENLYAEGNNQLLSRIYCTLHAKHLLTRNIDYIIKNGKVELVDEFTGRIAEKRRWPDGIQEALEIKEHVNVQAKGKILNSIILQHFLKLYPKLSGMTATANSAEEEFREFYGLHIVVIPTHKKCIRVDHPDYIYLTKNERNNAVVDEIIDCHAIGRPVLVGTRSVKESIEIYELLIRQRLNAQVLNAKNDSLEAEIIAQAGKPGAITISTNMAGRGTDIRLGGSDEAQRDLVLLLGGLYVIGTNKHESKRIDYQLRGRAGRQGDPGSSRFFLSLEDDLMVKYNVNEFLNLEYDLYSVKQTDESDIINEVNRIQRVIEGQNLEIKKTLYSYSALLESQRQIMLNEREIILNEEKGLDIFYELAPGKYDELISLIGIEKLTGLCRYISLAAHDKIWCDFLADIADLREGISMNRLGGQNPLFVFRKTSVQFFEKLNSLFEEEIISAFEKTEISDGKVNYDKLGVRAPSSTWTYLINDNPFEGMPGLEMMNNIAYAANAAILGPFLVLLNLIKRRKTKK